MDDSITIDRCVETEDIAYKLKYYVLIFCNVQ